VEIHAIINKGETRQTLVGDTDNFLISAYSHKRLYERVTRKVRFITDTPFPNECNGSLPSHHSRELRARLTGWVSVKGSCPLRRLVGGTDGTELDIAEGDSSIGLLRLDIAGLARGGSASTTSSADLVGANGVG
jgi:hypothetical protein